MSMIGSVLILGACAIALVGLLVAVVNDHERKRRVAERHWRDVDDG
jgi:hypothetical protein